MLHSISCHKKVKHGLDFELVIDTPPCTLMGEIWGVYSEEFEGNGLNCIN